MIDTGLSFSDEPAVKNRIVIVDDIRTDLHYMGKLINGFGHETLLAESGAEALALIDGATDLVIADGIMPGMDGFEFVTTLRKTPSIAHIPVIMVTSLSGRDERIRAVEAGINDFITKPVDKVELKVRVNSMLKMKEAQDRVRNYQKELEHLVEKKTRDLNTTLQKLQAVLNGMSDCMVTLTPDRTILEANQAFLRISDASADQIKGRRFCELLEDDQIGQFTELFKDNRSASERDMVFPQWGHRVFSMLVTHMRDGGHILVMRDVTEKVQANAQKARFLSILSHELRTPLNGIKGFSELMYSDPADLPPDYREYLGLIHACGSQLEAIVDELLRFVQFYNAGVEGRETDVRLDILVRQAIDALNEKMQERGITSSLSLEGPPPIIHGQSEHLYEMFRQIIDNAVKFNRPGGSLDVSLVTEADSVTFLCRDRGVGLPDSALDHVFDSFYQAEDYATRSRNGLGLGLTICKKIVELYEGTIRIQNRPGGGAEVRVTLSSGPTSS
ncbi:response regulator [Desulfatiferula olefinivorans]